MNPPPPQFIFNIFGTSTVEDPHHGILEKVSYSKDGQIFTKLKGCSYIYKGYPDREIMRLLDTSKEVSWALANILRNKIVLLLVILTFLFLRPLAKILFLNVCDRYFDIAYKPLKKGGYIPPEGKQYCQSVREFYQTSEHMLREVKNERMRIAFSKFRDLVLMVLELDTAYRFKAQDVISEVDVRNLRKNPIKEVKKILDLVHSREQRPRQDMKWKKIKKPLLFFLKISRKRRKQVIRFFSLLDYEKIKIDEDDWYFCLERSDYNYKGWNIEDRRKERKRIDEEKGHKIPIITMTPVDLNQLKQQMCKKNERI